MTSTVSGGSSKQNKLKSKRNEKTTEKKLFSVWLKSIVETFEFPSTWWNVIC